MHFCGEFFLQGFCLWRPSLAFESTSRSWGVIFRERRDFLSLVAAVVVCVDSTVNTLPIKADDDDDASSRKQNSAASFANPQKTCKRTQNSLSRNKILHFPVCIVTYFPVFSEFGERLPVFNCTLRLRLSRGKSKSARQVQIRSPSSSNLFPSLLRNLRAHHQTHDFLTLPIPAKAATINEIRNPGVSRSRVSSFSRIYANARISIYPRQI